MRKRESWIDVCKGIAIILVVIGHIESVYRIDMSALIVVHDFVYSFHMPLFLLISGYLSKRAIEKQDAKMS